MRKAHDYYPECPELYLVSLAGGGDRGAFAELVRRRQSQVRNLMRRFCNDATLADDLAQQVFLKVWLSIHTLKHPKAFNAWLKRLSVNVWLQYLRKNDALRHASELSEIQYIQNDTNGVDMDLDSALATLPTTVRLCVVLSYNDGMSHAEIVELTKLPLGTVKSNIRRGAQQLQKLLSAYTDRTLVEES